MARTLARPEPRRRLSWPDAAPAVGIHLGIQRGLLPAARRTRQIGGRALQIFTDNPMAWRRRPAPLTDAAAFIDYCQGAGIGPVAIHASYLINLAGRAEPLASQSRDGLIVEMQGAPAYGASLVNVHIGSHRGGGVAEGLRRVAASVRAILADSPPGVRLVLENSAGGGDNIGSSLEDLATILDLAGDAPSLAFCLDTAHLWGAGYEIGSEAGAVAVADRFEELMGLERLAMIHFNDSRSELGSRSDRHEHVGAGQIGPVGLGALLRDPRLSATTFIMETPGADEGWDAVNMRRAWLLWGGASELPVLPRRAFHTSRRSTRAASPPAPLRLERTVRMA